MTYTPDTRPIQICWTGPDQWTVKQIHEWLPPHLLNRGPLAPGKCRYMIHHPASWLPYPTGTHNMAQFYTLPEPQRKAYDDLILSRWKLKQNFTIGISAHMSMLHPFDRGGLANRYYDWTVGQDRSAMWDGVIRPWHELLGAGSRPGPGLYEWGLEGGWSRLDDAGRPGAYPKVLGFSDWLMENHKIRTILEAIPTMESDGHAIDEARCMERPSWCLAKGFADNNIAGQIVPAGAECHALCVGKWNGPDYLPTLSVEQIVELYQRGFIVGGDLPHDDLIREARKKVGLPIG